MQKKHITLIVVFNIFLILAWSLIVWRAVNDKLDSLGNSITSTVWTQVNDIKKSDILAIQSSIVHSLASAQQSVVSIMISKDVKFYIEDPSQVNGPGSIQQQTAKVWWWSGIIVSKQGYILTNKHVVQDTAAKYGVTLSNGKTYNVDKIWFDDLLDLAILRIIDSQGKLPTDLVPASLLSLDTQVDIGQFTFVIGNSLSNYANSVTMGIIWGKNKQLTINKNNLYVWLYQTDAQANPGNSGGPLLDINGNTLWITTAIAEGEGMTFALPISKEFVAGIIKSIENFWKIARPIIGIQYVNITPTLKQEKKLTVDNWIFITDVLTDLPAAQAWLKVWDSVLSINGEKINNQLPFLYQLYTYVPGDQITLDIVRNGEEMKFNVLLWWKTQQ